MGGGAADQEIAAFRRASVRIVRIPSHGSRGHVYRRILQERPGLSLRRQQGPDFLLERIVARAGEPQKSVVLFRRTVQDRLKQGINLFPAFGFHLRSRLSVRGRATPWLPSSRVSQ